MTMTKRALITGGAGFIAHHLIGQILKTTDWEVITLDRLDYSGNLNRLHDLMLSFDPEVRKRVKIVHHDLKAELNPLVRSEIGNVDYILHLAAGSHVDRSILYPMEFVMDNVVATCNILEFARLQKDNLERFVYFGTDEVFGPAPNGIKYKENDRYNSTNPYSATKAGGEELAVAYENTYNLPIYITHTMKLTYIVFADGLGYYLDQYFSRRLTDHLHHIGGRSCRCLHPATSVDHCVYGYVFSGLDGGSFIA